MSVSHVAAPAAPSLGSRLAVIGGLALYAVVGVFVISSGLLMPAWAIVAWLPSG